MKICDYLSRDSILTRFPAEDRDGVIRDVVQRLVELGKIPERSARTVVKGILDRETLGSTGVGRGIGIPHTKTRVIDDPVIAFVKLADPLRYGATDGAPVHSLFFVISPFKEADLHVSILRWISTVARSDYYIRILRNTDDPGSLLDLFEEIDGDS